MTALLEWAVFLALSCVAIFTAAGVFLTMSMYRAGLALMSCLVSVAGLFVLLEADLLAAIQIMMNVGGMLVMVLVMVMAMMDPGGQMMWEMKRSMHMKGPGALSMHMPSGRPPEDEEGRRHDQMMRDMAMSTAQLRWALVTAAATALVLVVLILRTEWPRYAAAPTRDATNAVGELLLTRYMIGFEGAAFLILAGMAAAVVLGRREHPPRRPPPSPAAEQGIYTCPMHPEIEQQGPGQCPKCGMKLTRKEETIATDKNTQKSVTYTCPMHPEVKQQTPGQCPKCGMRLEAQEPSAKQ